MRRKLEKPIKVLVVDDSSFARALLVKLLGRFDIDDCVEAPSGDRALELLAGEGSDFDLVVSDVSMPGMSGFDLVTKLRLGTIPAHQDIPIILVTGKSGEKNRGRAMSHRIDGYIVKPVTADQLFSVLFDIFG